MILALWYLISIWKSLTFANGDSQGKSPWYWCAEVKVLLRNHAWWFWLALWQFGQLYAHALTSYCTGKSLSCERVFTSLLIGLGIYHFHQPIAPEGNLKPKNEGCLHPPQQLWDAFADSVKRKPSCIKTNCQKSLGHLFEGDLNLYLSFLYHCLCPCHCAFVG